MMGSEVTKDRYLQTVVEKELYLYCQKFSLASNSHERLYTRENDSQEQRIQWKQFHTQKLVQILQMLEKLMGGVGFSLWPGLVLFCLLLLVMVKAKNNNSCKSSKATWTNWKFVQTATYVCRDCKNLNIMQLLIGAASLSTTQES